MRNALLFLLLAGQLAAADLPAPIREARNPDAIYRPVPLWWWDAEKLEFDRLRWQLDQLHNKGVDQVCVIYLSPLWSQPPYFTEDWWALYRRVVDYAAGLGMKVWLTDGVAWGSPFINNTVLQANPDFRGQLLEREETRVTGPSHVRHEVPEGYEVSQILGAFAYRRTGQGINIEDRHDLTPRLKGRKLEWEAPAGDWLLMIFYLKPMGYQSHGELGFGRGYGIDYTNPAAMRELFRLTVGEYERRVKDKIGSTIVGTFQDELVTHHHYGFPPYSKGYTAEFQKRMGYDIRPYLGALYYDAGRLTDKIRCAFFEVLLELFEDAFYKPYFQWHEDRKMMVSHDQYGRMDLIGQTAAYIDYFRAMSWFQAPGYDDWNQAIPGRNWRDGKLASSIAQLYGRPRVWLEALHSSGWGLDLQEQVMALNENYIYGANVYDKHGFYYSTWGSWYSWAPPDAHYRQPYWMHYRPFADYVTRMSYLQSRGDHVAEVGVFYPIHTIQANYSAGSGATDLAALTESYFWGAGQQLLKNRIDFHFINDGAIHKAEVKQGRLWVGKVGFTTVVLPPLTTIDLRTLRKLEEFASGGGLLIALAALPSASVQNGRADPEVQAATGRMFRQGRPNAVFLPAGLSELGARIRSLRPVEFETDAESLMYQHRRAADLDLFMLYNRSDREVSATVRIRAGGTPFQFDSSSGEATPVRSWRRDGEYTRLELGFAPWEAYHVYLDRSQAQPPAARAEVEGRPIELAGEWAFTLQPTLDNRWGDFRQPASAETLGPEARQFLYRLEAEGENGQSLGWHQPGFDARFWDTYTYSVGPRWWILGPVHNRGSGIVTIAELEPEKSFDPRRTYHILGQEHRWRPYSFSLEFGDEKDPDYYRTLGPKKYVDATFLNLDHADHFGLYYLYTTVHSPRNTRAVLMTATGRGSGSGALSHRLWVNGEIVSDPMHRDQSGQFGSLIGVDLRQGWNPVLIKFNARDSSPRLFVYVVGQDEILKPKPVPAYEGPPRLDRFAGSEFLFDIYGDGRKRVGWYRFPLPPGTAGLEARVTGKATWFVNGEEHSQEPAGPVRLPSPLLRGGVAALRLEHEPGHYGGAAIAQPIRIQTREGKALPGDWSQQGLLSYSGAALYRKSVTLPAEYRGRKLILDLGKVDASASVRVNGKEAGIRGWSPYRFDISRLVQPGENVIEVTVASTLANHYWAGTPSVHVYEGQTVSGLLGPVRIVPYTAP